MPDTICFMLYALCIQHHTFTIFNTLSPSSRCSVIKSAPGSELEDACRASDMSSRRACSLSDPSSRRWFQLCDPVRYIGNRRGRACLRRLLMLHAYLQRWPPSRRHTSIRYTLLHAASPPSQQRTPTVVLLRRRLMARVGSGPRGWGSTAIPNGMCRIFMPCAYNTTLPTPSTRPHPLLAASPSSQPTAHSCSLCRHSTCSDLAYSSCLSELSFGE